VEVFPLFDFQQQQKKGSKYFQCPPLVEFAVHIAFGMQILVKILAVQCGCTDSI
jgi:hypothetical protein